MCCIQGPTGPSWYFIFTSFDHTQTELHFWLIPAWKDSKLFTHSKSSRGKPHCQKGQTSKSTGAHQYPYSWAPDFLKVQNFHVNTEKIKVPTKRAYQKLIFHGTTVFKEQLKLWTAYSSTVRRMSVFDNPQVMEDWTSETQTNAFLPCTRKKDGYLPCPTHVQSFCSAHPFSITWNYYFIQTVSVHPVCTIQFKDDLSIKYGFLFSRQHHLCCWVSNGTTQRDSEECQKCYAGLARFILKPGETDVSQRRKFQALDFAIA